MASSKVYEVPGNSGNTRINRSIIMSVAGSERNSRMDLLSDQPFSEVTLNFFCSNVFTPKKEKALY